MANDGRDAEMNALLDVPGVDKEKVAAQLEKRKTGKTESVKTEPVKTEPIKTEPVKTEPINQNVSDPETIRNAMLREMWGEQFKTVEDFKKANIPAQLQELNTLRQTKQALETQLQAKPKHHYASDDIAKFDEFARATKITDAVIFNRLNSADVANMNDLDAMVLQHVIDNPQLASKSPQEIRKYFERKYNVDAAKVEAGDLTQEELDFNLMDLSTEANKAKVKLSELKSKIKMPELPVEEPDTKPKKWTPDVEKAKKTEWGLANEAMAKEFEKIPITMKGGKEPIINFVLPEETRKAILTNALDYAVSNQMEVNEANLRSIAGAMYSEAILPNLPEIAHAIFERARSMTEEEYVRLYHNPSPKNGDQPSPVNQPLSDDQKANKAFDMEMER